MRASSKNPAIPEAKRYLKNECYQWRKQQRDFYKKVEAIEDPILQWSVAITVHAILTGKASFFVRGAKGIRTQLMLTNIDVEEDLCDDIEAVLTSLGVEDPVLGHDDAGVWIINNLTGSSLAFLAWSFRHLKFEAGENINVNCGRVVYNPKRAEIIGVKSKYDPNDKVYVPCRVLGRGPVTGHTNMPDWLREPRIPDVGRELVGQDPGRG